MTLHLKQNLKQKTVMGSAFVHIDGQSSWYSVYWLYTSVTIVLQAWPFLQSIINSTAGDSAWMKKTRPIVKQLSLGPPCRHIAIDIGTFQDFNFHNAILFPLTFWNVIDLGVKCKNCKTINTITLENLENRYNPVFVCLYRPIISPILYYHNIVYHGYMWLIETDS